MDDGSVYILYRNKIFTFYLCIVNDGYAAFAVAAVAAAAVLYINCASV